jgi:hypothetical protein
MILLQKRSLDEPLISEEKHLEVDVQWILPENVLAAEVLKLPKVLLMEVGQPMLMVTIEVGQPMLKVTMMSNWLMVILSLVE